MSKSSPIFLMVLTCIAVLPLASCDQRIEPRQTSDNVEISRRGCKAEDSVSVEATLVCNGRDVLLAVTVQNCLMEPAEVPEGMLPWNGSPTFDVKTRPATANKYSVKAEAIKDYFNFVVIEPTGYLVKVLPVEHYKIELNNQNASKESVHIDWSQSEVKLRQGIISKSNGSLQINCPGK